MMQETVKVLLVDDHPVFREGIKARLALDPEFKIVGESGDGVEAMQQIKVLGPDVILLDITLPNMNGLEMAKIVRESYPGIKILVLTMHTRPEYAQKFFELGAKGYVIKDSPVELLSMAIRMVAKGQKYIDERVASPLNKQELIRPESLEQLSKREQEVLNLLAQCSRNKEIATKLGISVRTVEGHRREILKKMKCKNIPDLIRSLFNSECGNT